MINIFYRVNEELASWITIWRFLRGLDRDGLGFYQDIDGRADSSENMQITKREFKTIRRRPPVMAAALANKACSNSVERTRATCDAAIVMGLSVQELFVYRDAIDGPVGDFAPQQMAKRPPLGTAPDHADHATMSDQQHAPLGVALDISADQAASTREANALKGSACGGVLLSGSFQNRSSAPASPALISAALRPSQAPKSISRNRSSLSKPSPWPRANACAKSAQRLSGELTTASQGPLSWRAVCICSQPLDTRSSVRAAGKLSKTGTMRTI